MSPVNTPVLVQNTVGDPPVKFNFGLINSIVEKIKKGAIINRESVSQRQFHVIKPKSTKKVTQLKPKSGISAELTSDIFEPVVSIDLEENKNGLPFCMVCNKTFFTPELHKEHLNETELTCRVCTESFSCHSKLKEHFYTHNTLKCEVCKKVFYFKRDLLRHRETSESCNKRIKCDLCDKMLLSKKSLKSHRLKVHSGHITDNLMCQVCKKNFKRMQFLTDHLKLMHTAFEYVECKFCSKLFLGQEKLKVHIRTAHLDEKEECSFTCEICQKVFKKRHSYIMHARSHDKSNITCKICGKTVFGQRALWKHNYMEHKSVGEFTCESCERVFNTTQKLNDHLRRCTKLLGPREKTFFCEVCGKAFATTKTLKNHLMTHNDEKPHVCEICGAAFKLSVTLNTHKRVHTDENKYFCKECGMAFKWKQTFTNHQKKCKGGEDSSESD